MARSPRKPTTVTNAEESKPPLETAPVPVAAPLKQVQGTNYRSVYSNSIKIPISQWDIGLTFGQIMEIEGGGSAVQDEITIKMSPQYFKVFVDAMITSLAQWEKVFGEISTGLGQKANTQGLIDAFDKLQATLGGDATKKH